MNIGVDIDGVLVEIEKYAIAYGSKMCIEENLPIEIKIEEYYEGKKFNWTEEQEEKFWNKYFVDYITKSKPRELVAEVIEKLRQEGNKIYIITARNEEGLPPEAYGKMQELTKEWLIKSNIKYDKLIFAGDKEKKIKCKENKIDIMIEDSPSNIVDIASEIPVIKYYCNYNREVKGENIITAYSWYHIYSIIREQK